MGAYSPLPDLPDERADELLDRFHRPILAELARRTTPFRGALYAGLMLTDDGPVLLECNARFGDPETQVILPRLAAPLGPVLLAAARGRLREATRRTALDRQSTAHPARRQPGRSCSRRAGYPEAPRSGDAIEGLHAARSSGALVFHAGTTRDDDGGFRRLPGACSRSWVEARTSRAAREAAEAAAERISFDGLQRRHDIGLDVPAGVEVPA